MAKRDNSSATELVEWRWLERTARKFTLTRDFYINGRRYEWLCNQMTHRGILRHGVLAE